jgi:hypothetical protein
MGSGSRRAARRRAAGPAAAAGIIAVLLAGLAPLAAAAPGSASGGPHNGSLGIAGEFGLNPAPGPQGQASSYFQLSAAPGQVVTAAIVASNLADKTETLDLGRAVGVTAGNGGTAYGPAAQGCSGPACWVTGLQSQVTLAAGSREELPFTVRVPPLTRPGQYLIGITGESAAGVRREKVGSNGRASAQAVIVDVVTVGVAITVGNLPTLVNRLSVHGVQGTIVGPVARLNISIDNSGQTFARGAGQASCRAGGRRHSYGVYAGTVLPGDHAVVVTNAPGLPEGATVPCTIQLRYGNNQVLRWSGPVAIPSAGARQRLIHTGPGAYSELPASGGIPLWAIILMVLGGLILISLWAGVLLRRQRNHDVSDPPSD